MASSLLRRIRFRFGLKTLFFLVTLSAVVMGWFSVQWRWVSQRNEARKWVEHSGVFSIVQLDRRDRLPWGLRLVGERTAGCLCVNKKELSAEDEARLEELKRLFPEARVWGLPSSKKEKPE